MLRPFSSGERGLFVSVDGPPYGLILRPRATLRGAEARGCVVGWWLSQAVAGLIRRGLGSGQPGEIARSARTGLPVAHLGRTITSEDVRRLEDDDQ